MSAPVDTKLTRKVRLALPAIPPGETPPMDLVLQWTNNWVGGPATERLVPHVEVDVTIANLVDERTGYIEDITVIDQVARGVIEEWWHEPVSSLRGMPLSAAGWLKEFMQRLIDRYPKPSTVRCVAMSISPQSSMAIEQEHPSVIVITRQYEFSAAHRLHSNALTPQENESLYGKCNRIHGHGHNYLLDVSLTGELAELTHSVAPIVMMDRIVKEQVLARLDHRFLNREVPPFDELNPTVENIALTIWNWLDGVFEPAQLTRIRVYETAKTWVDVEGR